MNSETTVSPGDYSQIEHNVAKGMNDSAYAEHEAEFGPGMWPVFLPRARAVIGRLDSQMDHNRDYDCDDALFRVGDVRALMDALRLLS